MRIKSTKGPFRTISAVACLAAQFLMIASAAIAQNGPRMDLQRSSRTGFRELFGTKRSTRHRGSRIEGEPLTGQHPIAGQGAPPDLGDQTQIPYWSGQYEYQGVTYPFSMIGTDPKKGSATTVIPTVIIPLRFVLPDGSVLDATTDIVDGQTPVQGIVNSPIFQPYNFTVGGTHVGTTQFGDAYMRAGFWNAVSTTSPNYHVLLDEPTILPAQTINVEAGELSYFNDPDSDVVLPIITKPNSLALLETMLSNLHLSPNVLPIIEAGSVEFAGAGFHDSLLGPTGSTQGGRTYIYTSYEPERLFGDIGTGDVSGLSHEVAEWLMDPFVLNYTPGWNMPFLQTDGCGSQSFDDLLETGDVLEFMFPDVGIALPGAPQTYHVQDVVFLDFFTRRPSRSVNGQYSLFGVAQGPSTPCQGHLEFDYKYFAYPGSRFTEAYGMNEHDQIVGGYRDRVNNQEHGYLRDHGTYKQIDYPGASESYPIGINDNGSIAGYYYDGSGGLHGFSYDRGVYSAIDVPGALDTFAEGVNAKGDIVGGYDDMNFVTHGFVLHGRVFEMVESPFAPGAQVTSITENERLAGYTTSNVSTGERGFVRTNVGFAEASFPNTINTEPYALNSSNVLAGIFYNAPICECIANWSGFVTDGDYRRGIYRYTKGFTFGSNDRGKIVGTGFRAAFVATLPKARH